MEESLILYGLWEQGVERGELLWPDRLYDVTEGEPTVLEAYANPGARMFCLWNTQPRSPWQTQAYYDSEKAILHHLEFERMHRNQWITQTTTFVPMEWWDACKRDDFPEIPENWPMVMSIDAGTMKDNFGVLLACRHPDRENYPDVTLILYAKNWVPPKGTTGLDFQGTPENPGPELEIRRLISEYNVLELAYDEYQLHDMVSRFRKEGIVYCRRFPQGSGRHSRTVADAALYDKIRERKIWHRGEPDMRQHILNANAKIDKEERMLRIVKRVEHLKVDLAVGLSMASYDLFRLNL
jgi:phage terminase large subunit-like protein